MFRKFSSEKGKDFTKSTYESKNEAKAYAIGLAAFNEWLGLSSFHSKTPLFKDLARMILNQKLKLPDEQLAENTKRSSERDYEYLIKYFGHLKIDQITPTRWENHYIEQLGIKPQKFFNRRKALIEIMLRAQREGIIAVMPRFSNPDPAPSEGLYLEDDLVRRLLDGCYSDDQRMLIEIVWRQGARPGEVLQYEWSMINWAEGEHGFIHIPAAITKTRRARSIPLNPRISQLLRDQSDEDDGRHIFLGRYNPTEPRKWYRTGWEGAVKRAALQIQREIEDSGIRKNTLPELQEMALKLRSATIYDLRGTFITNCLDQGISSTLVGKYVDSSGTMIDKRYARRKQSAMQAIANSAVKT